VNLDSPYQLDEYRRTLDELEEASAMVVALMAIGCRWGTSAHEPLWRSSLQRLCDWPMTNGIIGWLNLRRYPATLALYGGGIGALADGRIETATGLLMTRLRLEDRKQIAAVGLLIGELLEEGFMQQVRQPATGNPASRFHTPASDHVHDLVRPMVSDLIPDDEMYSEVFDRFEFLSSLAIAQQLEGVLVGARWSWRHHGGLTGPSASQFVIEELRGRGDRSGIVTSGLVPSAERGIELATLLRSKRFFF
jgi:hypothetical protein